MYLWISVMYTVYSFVYSTYIVCIYTHETLHHRTDAMTGNYSVNVQRKQI